MFSVSFERKGDGTGFGQWCVPQNDRLFAVFLRISPIRASVAGVIYPLGQVLLLCLLGELARAKAIADIAWFGDQKAGVVAAVLAVCRGHPCPSLSSSDEPAAKTEYTSGEKSLLGMMTFLQVSSQIWLHPVPAARKRRVLDKPNWAV